MVEPDAAVQHGGNRKIARRRDGGGVVLEPREPPRAIHPESAQESNLADGGADVCRKPSTSSTWLAGARRPDDTNTTAPTKAKPNIAHASACQNAEPHRAAATGPYQHSHAHRRSETSRSPMPVTRTSFPGGAVVAMVKR